MNRKVLIGLLVVSSLYLSFASEAEARHRRFGRRGFGGGSAVAAIVGAGLLSNAFNSGCSPYGGYGYGGGFGGYAPYGYSGYGYGYQPYAYDPYYAAPVGYGYAPAYGGYGYNPYYGRSYRRRSNIIPALIGAGLLYSAFRR